jgi:hypothetical protein
LLLLLKAGDHYAAAPARRQNCRPGLLEALGSKLAISKNMFLLRRTILRPLHDDENLDKDDNDDTKDRDDNEGDDDK